MLWKVLTITFLVLTIHFGILFFTRSSVKKYTSADIDASDNRTKLIIDTDAGGDDAVAILLALSAVDKVQVVAITCVYGNTDEINVETNVLKILTVANQTDIPVYGGVKKPLVQKYVASTYFGRDGLGDFDFGRPVTGAIDKSTHAAVAMIEIVQKYPGAISILTLGPLSNVGLAASLDPNFTQNVKRFYVMGSSINETNLETYVEFNFRLDPESDAIFLKSLTKQTSFVSPWNVVLKRSIPKEWRKNVLGQLSSETMRFLNKVEAFFLAGETEWQSADTIAVATLIWPEIVTASSEASMTGLDVCETSLKGSVVVDYNSPMKNVEILRDFNVTAFQDKLITSFA